MRNVNSAKNWHPSPKREPLKFMQDTNVETKAIVVSDLGRHVVEAALGVGKQTVGLSGVWVIVVRSVSCFWPIPAPVFDRRSAFWLVKL